MVSYVTARVRFPRASKVKVSFEMNVASGTPGGP